jgi:integrase
MKMAITQAAAGRFDLSDKDEEIIWDETLSGFALRVRRRGKRIIKDWIVRYKNAAGKHSRMKIASFEVLDVKQARVEAIKILGDVARGSDPLKERAAKRAADAADDLILHAIIDDFLDAKSDVKAATLASLTRYLKGNAAYLGTLRSMPITAITRKDVASRVRAVARDHGIQTSICFRSALASVFSFATQMGLVESNVMIGSYKSPKPPSRERVLSDNEISSIWNGVNIDSEYGQIIRLLILTGCRRQEIGSMKWGEFNDDMTEWTLPTFRSKTAQKRTLPITPMMKAILDKVPVRFGVDHLFGRKGYIGWAVPKKALDDRLGLPKWVIHDIRRSVSTGMNTLEIEPWIVEVVLGHALGGIASVYNKAEYKPQVRNAMLRWSDHIASITAGGERKPLPFETRATA